MTKGSRRRPLSRPTVVEAALELIDRDGLEALTMQRLGQALGVQAMSLYEYVPSKEALLDAVVERLVTEIAVPEPDVGDWRARLAGVLRSYRDLVRRHPAAFLLRVTRVGRTSEGPRLIEAVLAIVREAGFDDRAAVLAVETVTSFVTGHVIAEIGGQVGDELAPAADRDAYPHIAALLATIQSLDSDAKFEFGLALILDALEARRPRLG